MEEFRDIPGYEGLYQVSNLGNVKSLGNDRTRKDKILKQSIGDKGYYQVCLNKTKIRKCFGIHRLVAMAFLNHTLEGMSKVIDHINDDKTDNRLENLQVVTQRFNACKTQGRYSSQYKGVSWHKKMQKWISYISINGKLKYLGSYKCELVASIAYQNKLKEILC